MLIFVEISMKHYVLFLQYIHIHEISSFLEEDLTTRL